MLVMKRFSMLVDSSSKKMGRPKKTLMEVARVDMEKCNISNYLSQDRLEWRNIIHVVDLNMVRTRLC